MSDQMFEQNLGESVDEEMSEREILLARAFDGELSPKEREDFERLCREDPTLQEDWDEMQGVRDQIRASHQADMARLDFAHFYEGVAEKLGIAQPEQTQEPSLMAKVAAWWKRYWSPVAVSTIAAVVAGLITVQLARQNEVAPSEEVQIEQITSKGSGLVLISQPTEEGEATVLWTLEDEDDSTDEVGEAEEAI